MIGWFSRRSVMAGLDPAIHGRRLVCALLAFFALFALSPAVAGKVKPLNLLDGATVWQVEDHSVPVIVLSASFPAGAVYDPSGKTGMAAFAAALLDEGAGSLNASSFQTQLAAHGIKLEVFPGRDTLIVKLTTLSANAKEAFRLLGLALNKPRFDADAVTRLRLAMMQGLDEGREDPETVAERGFYALYFGPYTYGRPVDGETRALASISPAELHAFAKSHWVKTGLKIAVAGDITTAALTPLLQASFGSLPDSAPPLPPPPLYPGAPGLHVLAMDVPQPAVMFGAAGLLRNDRDYLAALLANHILGGGAQSRLSRELRDNRGLTYDIATDLVSYRRAGLMTGLVEARKSAVRQTISALREVMRKFAAEGPTAEELADAKLYLNGALPLSFTSNADIVDQLTRLQEFGLPPDYLDRRAGEIDAVSLADVRRLAKRLFNPDKLTVVVAGSLPSGNTEPADSQ